MGHSFAKATAWARQLPFVGIDHMEGHLMAPRLQFEEFRPPAVVLLASGGHSQIVHVSDWGMYETLGHTIDDAAGEAFDKLARVMGLGFPGGPAIDKASDGGDSASVRFPRALPDSPYHFSFSGLKTSVVTFIDKARFTGNATAAEAYLITAFVGFFSGMSPGEPAPSPPFCRGSRQARDHPGAARSHPLHRQRRHDRCRRCTLALPGPSHRLGRVRRPRDAPLALHREPESITLRSH